MPAASVFRWLALASEKLPRLGLALTASVSPWLIWLMGKPRKTRSDGLGVSQDKPHNLSICCLALPQPVSLLPRPRSASEKNVSTTSLAACSERVTSASDRLTTQLTWKRPGVPNVGMPIRL